MSLVFNVRYGREELLWCCALYIFNDFSVYIYTEVYLKKKKKHEVSSVVFVYRSDDHHLVRSDDGTSQ